jgi:hypothetical protein
MPWRVSRVLLLSRHESQRLFRPIFAGKLGFCEVYGKGGSRTRFWLQNPRFTRHKNLKNWPLGLSKAGGR